MYNRYVPGANGCFERRPMAPPPCPAPPVSPPAQRPKPPDPRPPRPGLQPAQLDTGDLLVLMILLLILLDGEEDILSVLLALGVFLLF